MWQRQVWMLDFSNDLESNKVNYHNKSCAGQTCAIKQLTLHCKPNVSINRNYVLKSFNAAVLLMYYYVLTSTFGLLVDAVKNGCDKCNFVAKTCDLCLFKKDADHLLKLPHKLKSVSSFHETCVVTACVQSRYIEKSQTNNKLFRLIYDWLKLCRRLLAHVEKLWSYIRVSPYISYKMYLHLVQPYNNNTRNVVNRCKKYNFIELVICDRNHSLDAGLSLSKYLLYFKFVIKWLKSFAVWTSL